MLGTGGLAARMAKTGHRWLSSADSARWRRRETASADAAVSGLHSPRRGAIVAGMMPFALQPSSGTPIYRQIAQQVARLITGGYLGVGERLPSVGTVAADQGVNGMSVSKAYAVLEGDGLAIRGVGQGMFVSNDAAYRERSAVSKSTATSDGNNSWNGFAEAALTGLLVAHGKNAGAYLDGTADSETLAEYVTESAACLADAMERKWRQREL